MWCAISRVFERDFLLLRRTMINEIGTISAEGANQGAGGTKSQPIPHHTGTFRGRCFAYLFGELTRMGIDVVGESQLVGYPSQFPSVTMLDWNTGEPNARYWALKVLRDNFGPGDRIVESKIDGAAVYGLAVVRGDGQRRLLLVNRRDRPVEVTVPGAVGGSEEFVDGLRISAGQGRYVGVRHGQVRRVLCC